MFDISKEQLLQLSDVDLRELVARLCEAELSRKGAPVSAVRWGGSQTTPDGGLDADDPTGTNLGNREKAMQTQVESVEDRGDLRMEFYGRGRLADWLRQHPGVQLWVREKLGLPSSGWKPFGRWSTTPPGVDDALICEAGVTIRLPGKEQNKLDIAQGINGIRELVRSSGKAVRIVGLSGVGKSRIVQALFEEPVGDEPLDRHRAIYADLGEAPDPPVRTVLERLTAEGRPAIMVLDNCSSDAHNQFASRVAHLPNLRLVTVEYDIREDKPEETRVVRIDAEDPEIAETLIKRRHPDLGQVNARRIAKFSGGNARVALALADTVSEGESLSDFSNAQLFDRLFYQRGKPDTDLLRPAEVLALVYSFSIGRDEGGVDELATLAGLLGQDRRVLYRAAQTLVDRQLAQKRGNWRAVLPHAVSNRLARRALENIPVDDIRNAFQGLPSPRLLKSFGKRLGYLHDHEVAQDIAKSWLSPGGLLHNLHGLNEDSIQLLLNVAPAVPEDVLGAFEAQDETFFSRENPRFSTFVDLLAKIAYETELFERGVNLLAKFAPTEREGGNSIQDRLFGLFSLYLSGTEANPDARENLVRRFLMSDKPNEQRLGLGMLKAALQSHHWVAVRNFEFGARPRSYGYQPRTSEERDQWFMRFVALAREMATGEDGHLATQVRTLLAGELRGLWSYPGLREVLVDLAMALNEQQPWLEGWRAVREIKHYDYRRTGGTKLLNKLDEMSEPERPSDEETKTYVLGAELLDKLDETLKPRRLADEVRTYVLSAGHELLALDEEFDPDNNQGWQEANSRAAARAYDLGTVVAGEPHVMNELAQEFFTAEGSHLLEFGRGVASKCDDLRGLWIRLYGGPVDFHLSEVLTTCMDEVEFPEETGEVFDAYLTRSRESYGYMGGIEKAVAVLAEKAPFRFLDGIFFDSALEDYRHMIFREGLDKKNPLSDVSVTTLLDWCRQGDFQERLIMLSEAIYPFEKEPEPFEDEQESDGVVLSEQAHAIIDATQDPSTVLGNLCSSVQPSGWSGSLANIIAKRGEAFKTLLKHDRSDIREAAEAAIAQIKQWEERERHHERLRDEQREQRFE